VASPQTPLGELTVYPSWNSGEPTSKGGEERERKPKGMVLLLREGRKGEGLSSLRKKFLAPPLDLDLWPLDLKFVPARYSFQRYATTILEVSEAFMFRENTQDGQRDGDAGLRVQQLMRPPRHGRIIIRKQQSMAVSEDRRQLRSYAPPVKNSGYNSLPVGGLLLNNDDPNCTTPLTQ